MLLVVGLVFAFTIPGTFQCTGTASCMTGKIIKVVDGDTLNIDGGQSIRLALVSAPETYEAGGAKATDFMSGACPVGSTVLIDQDDGQTHGSYGRLVGVIYCNGQNLNESLLESGHGVLSFEFCDISEFASTSWAQKHGC